MQHTVKHKLTKLTPMFSPLRLVKGVEKTNVNSASSGHNLPINLTVEIV